LGCPRQGKAGIGGRLGGAEVFPTVDRLEGGYVLKGKSLVHGDKPTYARKEMSNLDKWVRKREVPFRVERGPSGTVSRSQKLVQEGNLKEPAAKKEAAFFTRGLGRPAEEQQRKKGHAFVKVKSQGDRKEDPPRKTIPCWGHIEKEQTAPGNQKTF